MPQQKETYQMIEMEERLSREYYTQSWCAKCRYNGLKKYFLFGTAFSSSEMEAEAKLREMLAEVLPVMPDEFTLVPGSVVFHPRDEY